MAVQPEPHYTVDEYLALEASTREKHEFFRGEVFAMGGASAAHNLLVANMIAGLHAKLRGSPCRVYPSDLRVRVSAEGLYTYPDVIVVCGKTDLAQPGDTLLNPTVLVEVLSVSSEAYDRGEKFEQYRKLESLRAYMLIAQDRTLVEHFARQPDNRWLLSAWARMDDIVAIEALDCRLEMSEIYLNWEAPAAPNRAA